MMMKAGIVGYDENRVLWDLPGDAQRDETSFVSYGRRRESKYSRDSLN